MKELLNEIINGNIESHTRKMQSGTKIYSIYHGDKRMYSWDKDVDCISFELHNTEFGMTTTLVSAQFDLDEIAETLQQHERYVYKTTKLRNDTHDYLSNNEWTRSGT